MSSRIPVIGLCVVFLCIAGSVPASAEPMDAGKAFTKGARGFVNLVTGWVEIPKRVHETSQESGALAGFTWGLLRGIGHGFVRTCAGAYELVTFPFPAPAGYEAILEPEYVFTEEPSQASAY